MSNMTGTPTRTATDDANAGVISPPAKRHGVRATNVVSTQDNSRLGGLVDNIGVNLGQALEKRLTEQNAYTAQRLANSAAARQGANAAINEVDRQNKRTGWQKGVFGESVQYREAQQRAATNAVQAEYLTQAASIDTYAGETGEEYENRLNAGLEKVLDLYKGDKDTQNIVASNWHTLTGKLAAKQAEAHHGYNQLQQRETYNQQVAQTFDGWTVESALAMSEQNHAQLVHETQEFFRGATKPSGMDDIAWRGSVTSNLQNALRKGNIGAYNAAKAAGFLDTLNVGERTSMDEAMSVYDTRYTAQAQLIYEEAEIAAMDAVKLEDAKAIYDQARANIQQLAMRSSGSDRANLALARAEKTAVKGSVSTQKAIDDGIEEARKIAMKAGENALKAQEEAERLDTLKGVFSITNPLDQADVLNATPHTQRELEQSLDGHIVDTLTRLTGSEEPLAMSEATTTLLSEVPFARIVAKGVNQQTTQSPLVKRAVQAFVQGYPNMADEDGILNEQGKIALQSIAQFEKNPANFRLTVGESTYAELQILKQELLGGKHVAQVEKTVAKYNERKGTRDIIPVNWPLAKNQTKQDYVQKAVADLNGGINLQGDSLVDAMVAFDTGLTIHGSDIYAARDYLKSFVESNNTTYRDMRIPNGEFLNKVVPDYNLRSLLDGAQRVRPGVDRVSALTPALATLTGELHDTNGNVLSSLDQVTGVTIEADTANGGFWLDSRNAQRPVYISEERMREWGEEIKEVDAMRETRAKRERGTVLQKWGRYEMTAPLSNLN